MAKINKNLYNSTHDVNYVIPSINLAELGKEEISIIAKKIVATINKTTNDYDAREEVSEILLKLKNNI